MRNFLRNNSTGAEYDLDQPQDLGPNMLMNNSGQNIPMPSMGAAPQNALALDYSMPIEIGGVGKGYRVKGDPFTAVLGNGQRVRLGEDTAASNAATKQRIDLARARQGLEMGGVQLEAAKQKLAGGGPGSLGVVDGSLEDVPETIKTQVRALAEGRMAFPSGMALRTPYWQKMLQLVSEHDPSFDAVNYNSRQRTRTDFTAGKSAQAITAFNTVMGHLDNLTKTGDALDNSSSPLYNMAANKVAELTGDPKIREFNIAKDAVVGELVKAFNNGHITDTQLKEWGSNVTNSNSPEQMKAVNRQLTELLGSKINAMGDQYNAGMGTTIKGINLLSPKSQEVYSKITGQEAPIPSTTPGSEVGQGYQPRASSPAIEADAPPPASQHPGKVMTDPKGIKYKSDGRNWVRIQ